MFKYKKNENYLDYIPMHHEKVKYRILPNHHVQIQKEHRGVFFYLTQKLLKKPRISFIEMDDFGSFIWNCIDGTKNVLEISKLVHEKFGEKAEPLIDRLVKFMNILYQHRFIVLKREMSQEISDEPSEDKMNEVQ